VEETTEQIIASILADILDLDPVTIDDDTAMENVGSWDSMNHINVVLALEERFGVVFDVEEIELMISFYEMVQTVELKI